LYDDGGMLTVYRRHNPSLCKSTDRYYKRCTCPTWVEGMVGEKYIRQSLKTRSWERAGANVRKMEATENPTAAPARKDEPVTIERAANEYLADPRPANRERRPSTSSRSSSANSSWRGQKAEGYKLLREFDLRVIQAFRATWNDGALAKKKKQERLTGFFWFCIRAGWLAQNDRVRKQHSASDAHAPDAMEWFAYPRCNHP
jgi:integrase/recombinase XerD